MYTLLKRSVKVQILHDRKTWFYNYGDIGSENHPDQKRQLPSGIEYLLKHGTVSTSTILGNSRIGKSDSQVLAEITQLLVKNGILNPQLDISEGRFPEKYDRIITKSL